MLYFIVMILIDIGMVGLNFHWAKKEQDRGRKGLEILFTVFAVIWIVFFGFDVVGLINLLGG
jgi:hypothetical protein